MAITAQSTPDQIKAELANVDPKDRAKVREITKDATPKQAFEVILPFMYTKSPTAQEKMKGVNAVFQFTITGENGGDWALIINNGALSAESKKADKPNCSITMAVNDWKDMNSGKLDPQAAFMAGKIKFQGDMGLVMKLGALLRPS